MQLVLYGPLFLQILHSIISEADDLGLVPWLRVGGPRSCKYNEPLLSFTLFVIAACDGIHSYANVYSGVLITCLMVVSLTSILHRAVSLLVFPFGIYSTLLLTFLLDGAIIAQVPLTRQYHRPGLLAFSRLLNTNYHSLNHRFFCS